MLEVRGLDAFYGDAQALWDVALDVGAAETVSIVGPNGAGKTTLVNTIAGTHRTRRGGIVVDGVDVTAVPAHAVCECGVAAVPEGRRVFAHMTVFDNLCLGAYRKGARRTYREELERVYALFPRLQERSTQLAGRLSGGEQQMLAVGRALMYRPRLLLLDEPSSGLDRRETADLAATLRSVQADQGFAILLVEHDVELVAHFTERAYVLDFGTLIAEGATDAVLDDPVVRTAYLGDMEPQP
jgi:branched-chain amino acid transport system ATP-binding protein